jgi:16S rRNA A1518/A1519 N6-dimethyltransferase RsmA/KsgA/DIM1 with predicted DNA glycosylase/AP lyase activity
VPIDDELSIQTNSELDQHFLSAPAKLASIIKSAEIQLADHVVEIGGGVGTVAEHVPVCQSLTVIEYDVNLIPHLRKRVPHARVIQDDALQILPTLRCDVLLSNLPSKLTSTLIELLPSLEFRVALVTVSSIDKLVSLEGSFMFETVSVLEPDDFWPRQAERAMVVRITRVEASAD